MLPSKGSFMITKKSVGKIQNLVVNPESQSKSNSG